ncbi:MAG: glycosyltransferase family 4 protein [Synechococcales cyanobacterium RM1_1_8]|nr:glycosyltransferase family 4 protein [Synechococcales cyanobacterium RM1_1_8]
MSPSYALVHEWLTPQATGGSELVVEAILGQIEADLYALIDFESTNPESYLYGRQIGTTFLQHFPGARNGIQKYLPFLPLAIEQLDLRQYDVLISSSHAVAKGVLAAPHQLHLCYCHTPMRYAWDLTFDYLARSRLGHGLPGIATRYLLHRLRLWDVLSAHRVDYFVANSHHTARRIWRCYRREAAVIYPPVNVDRFELQTSKKDFYLVVARLVSYKQVPLIVQAFNQLRLPLVVIGSGPELGEIEAIAQDHIQILGNQPNAVVERYMAEAKALVYAACEDFGITLVEAQACGTPVIAYGAGGAAETVKDLGLHGEAATGLLFPEQTVASLVEAVGRFEMARSQLNPETIRHHAEGFSQAVFAQRFSDYLRHCGGLHRQQHSPPQLQQQLPPDRLCQPTKAGQGQTVDRES